MLIDQDQDPAKSIYFVGARIIQALKENNFSVVEPNQLYRQLNNEALTIGYKIPFDYFLLALDWLFLLATIEVNEKGDLVKCF